MDLGVNSVFGHQYAYMFNERFPKRKFKFIDGVIKRVE